MQQKTKLIECQDAEGKTLSFVILNNQQLGKGSYGVVRKAYQQSNQHQQLAVKIIKYGDQKSKSDISRQVEVLRHLDHHPNLLKIIPLQCFSQKNFYIFMEYCNQGTLSDQMRSKFKNKENFSEEEIFKAFYEILKGYEALYKKGILHQDLKPDNILIKNDTYKLADFGFSIFYKQVQLERVRLGTCEYMPLQKLTSSSYKVNPKSDVYSLGVIFFKMIAGRHPYVTKKYEDHKQFIVFLKKSALSIPPYLKSRLSMPMQELFDLILRMVAKDQKNRVDFDEIYEFINENEIFVEMNKMAEKERSQFYSVQVEIPNKSTMKPAVKFVEVSKAFMIPFSIPKSQEQEYLKRLKQNKVKAEQKAQIDTIIKLQNYICSMRIMVYFFDRLTRRLLVEKKKKELKNWKQDDVTEIEQNAILGLVHTAKKITVQTIEDSCYQRVFRPQEWRIFKSTKPPLLKLVESDKDFLSSLANQLAIDTKQSKISDRLKIIQNSNKPLLAYLTQDIRQLLIKLLKTRSNMIPLDNKQELITIYFIINAIDIIDNFKERHQNWESLQTMFRKMESEELVDLIEKTTNGLNKLNIHYSLDEGDW